MERSQIIDALNALAQETRLDIFRLIVAAGPAGLTPTVMARQLKIAPPTLSFHLGRLAHAGLVRSRRRGRSIGYSAETAMIEALLETLGASLRAAPPAPEPPVEDQGARAAAPKPKDAETKTKDDAPATSGASSA